LHPYKVYYHLSGADWSLITDTISKKLGYSLSPQPSSLKLRFERGALVRGALVDRCVAPVDRNGMITDNWSLVTGNW
jgi:hypothetical protein